MAELTKTTVNVTARATAAMEKAMRLRTINRTDVVNQALVLYALVAEAIENGGSVTIRRSADAEPEKLVLL